MHEVFLKGLAQQSLPFTVREPSEVAMVRDLRDAGQVLALIFKLDKKNDYARVLTITPEGRKALAKTALADKMSGNARVSK